MAIPRRIEKATDLPDCPYYFLLLLHDAMRYPSQLIRTLYDSHPRLGAISGAHSLVDGKMSGAVGSSLIALGNARPSPLIFYLLVEGSA